MSWLSPGRWILYGAFIATLMLGIWRLDVSRQQIGYDRRDSEQVAKDLAAEKKVRDKETEWQQNIDRVAYDAQEEINALEAQLSTADNAADRLHDAAKRSAKQGIKNACTSDTSKGEPNSNTLDLLVEVLDRHSRELVTLGGYADKLRIAGLACEVSYDALTSP